MNYDSPKLWKKGTKGWFYGPYLWKLEDPGGARQADSSLRWGKKKSLKFFIYKKQNNQLSIIDSWKNLYHSSGLKILHRYRIKKIVLVNVFTKKLMHGALSILSMFMQTVVKLTDLPILISYAFEEFWQLLWYEIENLFNYFHESINQDNLGEKWSSMIAKTFSSFLLSLTDI